MDTNALKKFAQEARRELLEQVEARLEQVLHTDSVELREKLGVVNELRAQLQKKTKENLIEEVAYTWFNRFCALRYMDANHITKVGVVSPMPNFTQPEILQEAKQGIFDKDWRIDQSRVRGLLNGSIASSNPEQEAYHLLLVAVCNSYADEMDFLFPRIEDYTELLMPEDLLSTQSVLHSVREALTEEVCQDVEVIGWLYQFYISEKKDQVMGQKGKVAKEDIPAVTQLFTPHWIVRYMVENSLGRLWLLNHPESKIRNQMEYYIPPGEDETNFLVVDSPEDLKILDPACGSGHILTYAFDLLFAIYEEMGYDSISIPQLILEKNLYGIEIDKRAAMLSSFALMMKAVERDKKFFTREVQPNILEMEDVSFDPKEVKAYMAKVGEDLWTQDLWMGLQQFENAKTFGSLIRPTLKDVPELRERLNSKGVFEDLFLGNTNDKVQKVLEMSEYLSPRYHVVLSNPPYLQKSKYLNILNGYIIENFEEAKYNLYAVFIERNLSFLNNSALLSMITLDGWMYKKYYGNFRSFLLNNITINSLIHLGSSAFDTISGEVVSTTIFSFSNNASKINGVYIDCTEGNNELEKKLQLKKALKEGKNIWTKNQNDYLLVDGTPIIYQASKKVFSLLKNEQNIGDFVTTREGITTGRNAKFLRLWYEVAIDKIKFDSESKNYKWFPLIKGGSYRKWAGNYEYVVNWENDGHDIKNFKDEKTGRIRSHNYNGEYAFRKGFTWSIMASGSLAVRHVDGGFLFDTSGPMGFVEENSLYLFESLLNSKVADHIINILSSGKQIKLGYILKMPVVIPQKSTFIARVAYSISKSDWDAYETSWDFTKTPLLRNPFIQSNKKLESEYYDLFDSWQEDITKMMDLEETNNRLFITAYGIPDEISPLVPLDKVTLTCNPYYRYNGNSTKKELKARLLEDTLKEFISYAVGCMFGRFSLDKPGLILANQGETVEDYNLKIGEKPTFAPTETNVIPIPEGDWFVENLLAQFKHFLKVTFGEENFTENLRFIEDALGKDLQKYFLRDFYKDHVQMYKKCPIYWLFSSPNGSFNALIYMHRYTPETVSVVLNQYLREYRDKLTAHRSNLERISTNANAREKSKALKEIEDITKILVELKEYEDDVLYPLASRQIQIDLDDGVKVNYAKFGDALKKI